MNSESPFICGSAAPKRVLSNCTWLPIEGEVIENDASF